MSLAALIRSMAAAGATPEAIAIAVEAIEAAHAQVEGGRAAARERKRRQRERDKAVTVTGHERDCHVENSLSLPPSPQTPQPPTHTREEISIPREGPAKRASKRCPEAWAPTPDDLAVGAEKGLTPGEIADELAKFRDHTFGTARSDWSATFRNWLRQTADRRPARKITESRHDQHRPNSTDARFNAKQDNLAVGFRAAQTAAARYGGV